MKPTVSAIIVGLASVLALGWILSASQYTELPRRPGRDWPPHPDAMVSITDLDVVGLPGGLPNIPPGSTYPIYQVPEDQWFVLTRFKWSQVCCDRALVVEDWGGSYAYKLDPGTGSTTDLQGPLGFAFQPGSTVTVLSVDGGVNVGRFSMLGYLVDA